MIHWLSTDSNGYPKWVNALESLWQRPVIVFGPFALALLLMFWVYRRESDPEFVGYLVLAFCFISVTLPISAYAGHAILNGVYHMKDSNIRADENPVLFRLVTRFQFVLAAAFVLAAVWALFEAFSHL